MRKFAELALRWPNVYVYLLFDLFLLSVAPRLSVESLVSMDFTGLDIFDEPLHECCVKASENGAISSRSVAMASVLESSSLFASFADY